MAQRRPVCRAAPRGHPTGTTHGVAAAMFAFAKERIDHLRIDTHQDNLPMQGAIAKAGFKRAGIVYVSDGTPRVAFDWLREA